MRGWERDRRAIRAPTGRGGINQRNLGSRGRRLLERTFDSLDRGPDID
jgi:hypothetical protein